MYPFLLGLFPVLSLYAQNSTQVPLRDLLLPISFTLVGALVVWLIVTGLLGNAHKAALFATLGGVCFFNSGRLPQFANDFLHELSWYWVVTQVNLPPRPVFLTVFLMLAGLGLWLASRLPISRSWTKALNLFALLLVILPIMEIARTKPILEKTAERASQALALAPPTAGRPDIYYIILDGYARSDVMQELFNFDTTRFEDHLRRQGFLLAQQSTSNYCQTPLSLSSSLNFEYLDELVKGADNDQTILHSLIAENRLARTLRPLGYRFVTFSTGFEPTEIVDSDHHLSPYHQFTEFQRLLIDQTPIWAFLSLADARDMFTQARDRILFLLDRLPKVAEDPRPTLTFAHIVCPHPPFLFGEQGEDIGRRDDTYYLNDGCRYQGFASDPQVYTRSYRDQAVYITRRIEQVVDQILARSPEPPIIILQSDHGSGLRLDQESKEKTDLHERMSILNAYYFPGHNDQGLYPEITPVNSFRVVLNTFFGAKLALLRDRNYFSTWSHPFEFMDVTSTIQHLQDAHFSMSSSSTTESVYKHAPIK